MAVEILEVQIDADLKRAVEKLYRDMGINFSEVVRLFAKKSVELGKAPFAITTEKNRREVMAKALEIFADTNSWI